jgi:hypothetical protein
VLSGGEPAARRRDLRARTEAKLEGLAARIMLSTYPGGEAIIAAPAAGRLSGAILEDEAALKLPSEPVRFEAEAGDLSLAQASLKDEATFVLKIESPAGEILRDALYADGFKAALEEAVAALSDPLIAQPLTERCIAFLDRPVSFWRAAEGASESARSCDPRTAEQRVRDARAAPER